MNIRIKSGLFWLLNVITIINMQGAARPAAPAGAAAAAAAPTVPAAAAAAALGLPNAAERRRNKKVFDVLMRESALPSAVVGNIIVPYLEPLTVFDINELAHEEQRRLIAAQDPERPFRYGYFDRSIYITNAERLRYPPSHPQPASLGTRLVSNYHKGWRVASIGFDDIVSAEEHTIRYAPGSRSYRNPDVIRVVLNYDRSTWDTIIRTGGLFDDRRLPVSLQCFMTFRYYPATGIIALEENRPFGLLLLDDLGRPSPEMVIHAGDPEMIDFLKINAPIKYTRTLSNGKTLTMTTNKEGTEVTVTID